MKKTLFLVLSVLVLSCSKEESNSKHSRYSNEIEQVIATRVPICKSQLNCIKPINIEGSKVKALEINVHGTEKVTFTTYDANGAPIDLGPDYLIEVKAIRDPALIDANIVPKEK